MTDHTPGPWHVGTGHGTARDHAVCAGPHIIAKVNGNGYPTGLGWSPESAANAALIASAPDLLRQRDALLEALDALEWIVEFCSEHPEWFGEGTPDDGAEFEWLHHARAVILSCEAPQGAKQGAMCQKESTP